MLICVAANVRIFGDFSFIALFLFPINEFFVLLAILAVVMKVIGKQRTINVAIVTSGVVSYIIAMLLPFSLD